MILKYLLKFNKDYGFVMQVFIVWRVLLFVFEFVGMAILPFKFSFPYVDSSLVSTGLPQWLWQWGNFDGVHYLNIVKESYDGFGRQVFFPGYSLAMKLLSFIIPNSFLAGLIISHLSILFAGILLFKFSKDLFNEVTARWTILFLFFFPTSFYFGSIYTEALYLGCILGAFYFGGVKTGIFSFIAGLTRLSGVFLLPSLLLDSLRRKWGTISLLGLGSYMAYLMIRFGDPFFFITAQSAFRNARATELTQLVTPVQVGFRYLKIFLTVPPLNYDFWVAVLEFGSVVLAIILLIKLILIKKLPKSVILFSWLTFLLPTFTGTFSSMPRYLITIFPIYIVLALIKDSKIRLGILGIFILLLAMFTALFTRGYWVA